MKKKNVAICFDRRKTAVKTGMGAIEICIYLGKNERMWESVGSASPNDWLVEAQRKDILAKMDHYQYIINAMKLLNHELTIENFKKLIFIDENGTSSIKTNNMRKKFTEFCRKRLERERLAKNSIKDILVVLRAVDLFGKLHFLKDLTRVNILAFDAWLREKGTLCDQTIHDYHKKLRKYIKILLSLGMIEKDPYENVKIPRGFAKERVPLTEEELLTIREAILKGHLDRARDLFIFMAYTGLSYSDLEDFDYYTMVEKHNELYYIDGSRHKTSVRYYTPILPPAWNVLVKYNCKLPVISNQKLNDYLHVIQMLLNIHKEMTCHVGRHSFATLMLSYGFPMEYVQKMLGHRNIKTTQIYGKVLKQPIENMVEKMIDQIK